MSRKKDVRTAAAEGANTAADRGAALVEQALDALAPLLEQASEKLEQASDRTGKARQQLHPYTDTAKERIAPLAETAKERIAPLAETAKDRADTARKTVAPLAATAAAGIAHKAKEQVEPGIDQARQKVQEELVPQLLELLHQAEQHPAVHEATKRSTAAAAALRGDLALPEKKKRSVVGTAGKVAASGALLAAVAVAVRQFLATKDDAWTAHQPSTAYRSEDEAQQAQGTTEPVSAEANWVDAADKPAEGQGVGTESSSQVFTGAGTSAAGTSARLDDTEVARRRMSDEGGLSEEAVLVADEDVLNTYGEGSYVGDEPPAGFQVKGNERSMKYHTTDSEGYERTIADVWFNSVEAAEQAGFSQAQR